VFVTIEARDSTLATVVHDARYYAPEDLRFATVELGYGRERLGAGRESTGGSNLPTSVEPVEVNLRTAGFEVGLAADPLAGHLVQCDCGINPGTPVSTTGLNRTLVVMPSRISCIASSGSVETPKFSWI
jgi:hypothetical protein